MNYRPDIDGLRTIAVRAVVLCHFPRVVLRAMQDGALPDAIAPSA